MDDFYPGGLRFTILVFAVLMAGKLAAQFPNPDASILFSRASVSGTAASIGAGGAFSSVGNDLGCIDLNPAGLGLYKSSDLCITPGIKISSDRSAYDGNTMKPVWGNDESNTYIIVNGIVKPATGVYPEKEWKMEGNIPVPVLMLILSGIARPF